jgi:hypothetical protein
MPHSIEQMTTEEAVKKYLQPFVVQELLKTNIDKKKLSELDRYRQLAGFNPEVSSATEQLQLQEINDILHSAMKQLGLSILIKRPPFNNRDTKTMDDETKETYFQVPGAFQIIHLTDKISITYKQEFKKQPRQVPVTKKNWRGKIVTKNMTVHDRVPIQVSHESREPQFLVEVSTRNYIGQVPESVIIATGKAVEAGLYPKVWIAGTRNELKDAIRIQVDPIVIGYPSMSPETYNNSCGLLIAAWGKDLEVIDQYFSKTDS